MPSATIAAHPCAHPAAWSPGDRQGKQEHAGRPHAFSAALFDATHIFCGVGIPAEGAEGRRHWYGASNPLKSTGYGQPHGQQQCRGRECQR